MLLKDTETERRCSGRNALISLPSRSRAQVFVFDDVTTEKVGVKLSNGRQFFAKTIVSNATRWDTFGKLLKSEDLPKEEESFQKLYVKAPSFLSIHMGVKADVLPPDPDCHHFVLEDDGANLEKPYGSIFLSIPTVLDSSVAPEGSHILHIFTTSSRLYPFLIMHCYSSDYV